MKEVPYCARIRRRFQERIQSVRILGPYRQDSQPMTVNKLERRIFRLQFIPQSPDAEAAFVDVRVVDHDHGSGISLGSHVSKSCRTAS